MKKWFKLDDSTLVLIAVITVIAVEALYLWYMG